MEPEPALRFSVMQVKCSKPYPLEQDAAFLDERGACSSYVAKSVRAAGSSPWWHESCRLWNDGTACAQGRNGDGQSVHAAWMETRTLLRVPHTDNNHFVKDALVFLRHI